MRDPEPQVVHPERMKSLSPGLRGTSYPGKFTQQEHPTLKEFHQAVCHPCYPGSSAIAGPVLVHTVATLSSLAPSYTKTARRDCEPYDLPPVQSRHHPDRQVVHPERMKSLSPGLRGTSYPGKFTQQEHPTLKEFHQAVCLPCYPGSSAIAGQ